MPVSCTAVDIRTDSGSITIASTCFGGGSGIVHILARELTFQASAPSDAAFVIVKLLGASASHNLQGIMLPFKGALVPRGQIGRGWEGREERKSRIWLGDETSNAFCRNQLP